MNQPCPILVINLDRSADRLMRISQGLSDLGLAFERVRAIDAKELSPTSTPEPSLISRFHSPLTPTERACCMSHGVALRRAVELGAAAVLVLEDDVSFGPGFRDFLLHIASQPELLPDATSLFAQRPRGRCVRIVGHGHRLIESVCPPISAAAVLWTRAGARKFIPACDRAARPIDVERKHWWEWDLSHGWIESPPVKLHPVSSGQSTIGIRGDKGIAPRIRKHAYHIRFTLAAHANYLRHRGVRRWLEAQAPIGN